MPPCTNSKIVSGDVLAGPRVQMIFVLSIYPKRKKSRQIPSKSRSTNLGLRGTEEQHLPTWDLLLTQG